ncbi:unnamed protein product [Brassica oleracea var. botrytis]
MFHFSDLVNREHIKMIMELKKTRLAGDEAPEAYRRRTHGGAQGCRHTIFSISSPSHHLLKKLAVNLA